MGRARIGLITVEIHYDALAMSFLILVHMV